MTITPDVIGIARRGRAATVETAAQRALTLEKAWVAGWDDLAPDFEGILERIIAAQDGEAIPAGRLVRDRRIIQALGHTLDTLDVLAADTAAEVSTDISPIVLGAMDVHLEALAAQLPDDAPGKLGLGVLDTDAQDAIVARTTERITSALLPLPAATVAAMSTELRRGVMVGDNPRAVAGQILKRVGGAFEGGRHRAETIARTEMLDAHRAADQAMAHRNRSAIAAAVWTATLDRRTCPACLAMHGTEHPPEEMGPADHPRGRCAYVYRTRSWAELGFTGIDDAAEHDAAAERQAWWDSHTESGQDAILGRTRADLLRSGQITWDDLATRRENPDWRASYMATPIRDLLAAGGR